MNDTQAVLLSAAARADNGSLYPLPEQLAPGARVSKAIAGLVSRGLAEERDTSDPLAVHRTDGDLRFGLFVTAAGLQAIDVELESGAGEETELDPVQPNTKPERQTKSAAVVALLSRPDGATLAELIAATDWLPHTTRAALTGLRKKGHRIERGKRDGATCYTIVGVAA
ncbi:DUF3489 domain-containing protein [uncultured Sphingomonas sp.]|uniref:DUF3489 domain-containing protein n=1 Tax=uncultured Sphingomonas sp. TaxID=158754 RepID=UPI0035CA9A22